MRCLCGFARESSARKKCRRRKDFGRGAHRVHRAFHRRCCGHGKGGSLDPTRGRVTTPLFDTVVYSGMVFPKIRATILKIPKGKVATYGDVAKAAGFPGAARQVVWALRNARGLPWHRVLGAGGKIMLPGESGLEQRLRLETEGLAFPSGRVWQERDQHPLAQ